MAGILHQIWYNFSNWGEAQSVPTKYDYYRQSWINLNPTLEVRTWDERSSESLLIEHYPTWLEKWRSFEAPIQRADFFRLVALYHFGGIYADMDTLALNPIPQSKDIKDKDVKDVLVVAGCRWVTNACMIGSPRHPALKLVLDKIPSDRSYIFGGNSVIGVFASTGPAFVRYALQSYQGPGTVIFDDKLILHLPESGSKVIPNDAKENYVAVHFGDGSWGYEKYLFNDIIKIIILVIAVVLVLLLCVTLYFRSKTLYRNNTIFLNKS